MKRRLFAFLLLVYSVRLHATDKVVVSNTGQGWANGGNFLPSGVPQSGDDVYIPPGLTITVKGNIYSTPPTLKIYALGTLDFDPSGRLALNQYSLVQLQTGGKITSSGSASEQITIGGMLKYQGSIDGTVLGPKFASIGTAVSGPVDDAGFIYGVLPIKIDAFTISLDQKEVTLDWTLSHYSKEDKYTLQRKGSGDWCDVKAFYPDPASKNPQVRYTHKDKSPTDGVNQYRLMLQSSDGTASYSKILSATFHNDQPKTFLYPNPAREGITIQWGRMIRRGNLSIIAASGSVSYSIDITTPISSLVVDVSQFKAGTYYVLVKDNGTIVAQMPFLKTE
jgi:hypothetical protein